MCDFEKLKAPFKPDEIEWRIGVTNQEKTKGLALAYVTNRAIQNRLDEVFTPFGWQNQYREWKGTSQICGISAWNDKKNEWITKWDGADDSQTEAIKGGLSDSMKRAAYQWGIGRYLYNLESVWVDIKQQGKSYVITQTPKLPVWALPEGYKDNSPSGQNEPNKNGSTGSQNNSSLISEPQAKRFFALGKGNNELVKKILLAHGYTESKNVKKSDYEKICKEIETQAA